MQEGGWHYTGWLSDFDTSVWSEDARTAAHELRLLLDTQLWVTLQVPRTDADRQPAGWRDVAILKGKCDGYLKYSDTAIDLLFDDESSAILDFAEFESRDSGDTGDFGNRITTLVFNNLRVIFERPV